MTEKCAARFEEYRQLPLQKQAQIITDNLLLGPLQIAENEEDIQNLGITAILSVLGFQQNEAFNNPECDIERKWICVEDRVVSEQEMITRLPEAIRTIHEWKNQNRVVYVHCQSGISRSATVVIAYMMKYHGMSLMESYKHVFSARPVINPNDGFFRALQDFAATECGVDYSVDENRRETELFQYNAYQLVAQLDFTGVTLDEAVVALERKNGDVNSAASSILSKFERA